jgi:hypothetical protein
MAQNYIIQLSEICSISPRSFDSNCRRNAEVEKVVWEDFGGSKDTRLDEEVRQTRKCDSPEPSRFGATAKLKMASALHAKVLEIHFRLSSLTALPRR